MKFFLFLTMLITIAKGGIWVCCGILIRKHFHSILTMIIRKPMPQVEIDHESQEPILKIIGWLGLCFMAIGVLTSFFALSTFIVK